MFPVNIFFLASLKRAWPVIDSPRVQTVQRRARFNTVDLLQTFTRKPVASLRIGADANTVLLMEAVGHDVRISCECRLRIGQRFVLALKRSEALGEVEIPGVVDWADQLTPGEYGVALPEPIPRECVIRQPDCQRHNLRYDCSVSRQFCWHAENAVCSGSTVVNYSREGICLEVRSVPAMGSRIQFTFRSGTENHAMNGFLRWVISQNGKFLVGCDLVGCLGYEIVGVKC